MLAAQSSNPAHIPAIVGCSSLRVPPTGSSGRSGAGYWGSRPRAVSNAEEDTSTIAALLDCGAVVGVTDSLGNTALHHATAWGNLKAVRMLLAAGAPPFVRNRAGQSPIEYSVTKQAAQYFQNLIAEQQGYEGGSGAGLKLNTAAAAASAAAAEEPRSAPSVQSRTMYPKNVAGSKLVIDTENNELAEIEDDDVPYTAKRVSGEEQSPALNNW